MLKCPICRKEVARDNPDFPFCSQRCRVLDLGNWASGKYVISTPLSQPEPAPEETRKDDDEE